MNINEYFNFNNVIIAIIEFFYEIIFMSNILQTLSNQTIHGDR